LALDLGTRDWKLAFTVGLGQPPRLKTITSRNTTALLGQIKAAKKRFGLPEDAVGEARHYRLGKTGGMRCKVRPGGSGPGDAIGAED